MPDGFLFFLQKPKKTFKKGTQYPKVLSSIHACFSKTCVIERKSTQL